MIDVIIEIPKNSRIKYEKDENTDNIRCDRYLKTPFNYPYNYGYIPGTLAPDNDPIDVFVLMDEPLYPGTVISVNILGAFKMFDNGESDDKLIAIPSEHLNFPDKYTTIVNEDKIIQDIFLNEIRFFLKNYKKLENKEVSIDKYVNADEALKLVEKYLLNK